MQMWQADESQAQTEILEHTVWNDTMMISYNDMTGMEMWCPQQCSGEGQDQPTDQGLCRHCPRI